MVEAQVKTDFSRFGDGPFSRKMGLMQKFGERGWIPEDRVTERPSKGLYGRRRPYPDDPYIGMALDALVGVMNSGDQDSLEEFMKSVREGFGERGMARLSPELEFLKGRIKRENVRKRGNLPPTKVIWQAPK